MHVQLEVLEGEANCEITREDHCKLFMSTVLMQLRITYSCVWPDYYYNHVGRTGWLSFKFITT